MTQSTYAYGAAANISGPAFRADHNAMATAIVSQNEGTVAPSPTYAGMPWRDMGNMRKKERNSANSAWIDLGPLDTANLGMQPVDATLTALAGVTTAANKLIYATGSDVFATTDLTAAGRAILDDADAAAQRTTLGLGTIATLAAPSGTVVGTSDPQTLTNKTLTAPALTNYMTFPSTQAASSGANDLDDYEEGSWTITLIGSSVAGTQTYTNQSGRYTKIGNLFFGAGRVTISAKDVAMAGNVLIGGLPFPPGGLSNATGAGVISYMDGVTLSSGRTFVSVVPTIGATSLSLFQNGSGITSSNIPVSGISSSTDIFFTVTYRTD